MNAGMNEGHFKILIADRADEYRLQLQKFLQKHFRHVDESNNGQEVLDLCEKTDYSLVIVENHLPGILGIEVVRRLEQKYPKMCRILTSEEDTDPVIESALEYGIIDRFLEKPLEASVLVWEVEYLLGLCSEPPPLQDEDEDEEDGDGDNDKDMEPKSYSSPEPQGTPSVQSTTPELLPAMSAKSRND